MARELLGIASTAESEAVKLAAVKDALDRAGLGAKQAVEVGVELKPYEEVLADIAGVARITRAESRARQGLLPDDQPALAAPADDATVIEAELVDEPPDSESGVDARQRTPPDRPDVPANEPASATRHAGRELVRLEDALEDTAQANRRARVVQVRRVRQRISHVKRMGR